GSVTARFSNDDAKVSLVSIGNGNWTGTWLPTHEQPQVGVAISCFAENGLGGQVLLSGSLRSGARTPLVNPEGVLNAASFLGQLPVAPGSLISLKGERLAEGTSLATDVPLGTELGGTEVTLGGVSLPLLYTSDGQINAQIPFN